MVGEVPGIIEACTMITRNPDGTVSFSVLIGPGPGGGERDLIELIIRPEHVQHALVTSGCDKDEEAPTFPCHVGFSRATA
jgi:hypothetical protein